MEKYVITIGRQFGSGGHDIGVALANKLQIPFYDKTILELAAKESGTSVEVLEKAEERGGNRFFVPVSQGIYSGKGLSAEYNMDLNDRLFLAESRIIKDIAEKGAAVIVGRAADYVLKDDINVYKVFLYANLTQRLKRITERMGLPEKKALSLIKKTDKRRASYYTYYTGHKWGNSEFYDLMINTACGIEKAVDIIIAGLK